MSDDNDKTSQDIKKETTDLTESSGNKEIDHSSSLLKSTLEKLKMVQFRDKQNTKINKLNAMLKTLHGQTPERSIEKFLAKSRTHSEKIEFYSLDTSLKGRIYFHYHAMAKKISDFKATQFETYDFIRSAFYALFLAVIIRSFVIQPFNIPSESMLPTLVVGDYIFVNKMAYGFSNYSIPFAPDLFDGRIFYDAPARGDVAVFRVPDDGHKDYIKRIIGLPGDKIQYIHGRLWLNDKAVPAEFTGSYDGAPMDPDADGAAIIQETLPSGKSYNTLDVYRNHPGDNTSVYIVPEGHYFVSGDNRDNSQDSRAIGGPVGFIPAERLIGRAEIIFFSLDRANFLEIWKWPSSIRFNRIFNKIE